MSDLAGEKHNGTFEIDGKSITGTLTVNGRRSSLYLRDEDFILDHRLGHSCILGTLHDLRKVSLFHCLTKSNGTASRYNEGYHQAELFPHYVLSGDRHLLPDEAAVTRITFTIDDAANLFHHPRDFGFLFNAKDDVAEIIKKERDIELGDSPTIVYFSGRREILRSVTPLGTFTVHNAAWPSPESADGIGIKNAILCQIDFSTPIVFDDAIGRLLDVGRFLDLIAGRQQNISRVSIGLNGPDLARQSVAVDWSMLKTRPGERRERPVLAYDVLIDGARSPEDFAAVLSRWLERNEAWRTSRVQFQEHFWEQGHLSVNRIVADANTFDILPDDAFPPMPPVDPAVLEARDKARAIFAQLAKSAERDSALSALGRLGRPTLKRKIAARADLIRQRLPNAFPDLQLVIDEAVNCRNFFVHASVQSFPYMKNWPTIEFFIDTLEFVFGASDLVEAGWDIQKWHAQGTSMSHPFGAYKITYAEALPKLKRLLTEQG